MIQITNSQQKLTPTQFKTKSLAPSNQTNDSQTRPESKVFRWLTFNRVLVGPSQSMFSFGVLVRYSCSVFLSPVLVAKLIDDVTYQWKNDDVNTICCDTVGVLPIGCSSVFLVALRCVALRCVGSFFSWACASCVITSRPLVVALPLIVVWCSCLLHSFFWLLLLVASPLIVVCYRCLLCSFAGRVLLSQPRVASSSCLLLSLISLPATLCHYYRLLSFLVLSFSVSSSSSLLSVACLHLASITFHDGAER